MTAVHSPNQSAETSHDRRWVILVVLCAVAFMAQLDLFIVNVALPSMGRSFHGDGLDQLSWVLNAYAIVFAAALVPAGRLADHFGRRRFLLVGVAVFTVASALCAGAPDLPVLVGARALQALGAAMIVPTSLGLLLPAFPAEQHRLVVGVWAGVAAIAASSGPPVGGLLLQLSWRWVFVVNVPIGIATVLAGRAILPEVRAKAGTRAPDAAGAVVLLAAVSLLVLATVEGQSWGWTSARELALYAGTVIATGVSVRRAFTHPRPLVEPALFRSRQFTISAIALVLFFMGFAAWLLGSVLFLQNAWHYSTVQTGLAIAPGPMTAALFALNAGRIADRFGRRLPAIAGPVAFAAGAAWWATHTGAHRDYAGAMLPGLILAGVASGLTQAPLFAAAGMLPPDRATTGSAVLNMARQVGSALGVAVLVAIYASPSPHSSAEFRHGWWLMVVTGTATAITTAVNLLPIRGSAVRVAQDRLAQGRP